MRVCAPFAHCNLYTSRCAAVDLSLLLSVAPIGSAVFVPPSAVSFF